MTPTSAAAPTQPPSHAAPDVLDLATENESLRRRLAELTADCERLAEQLVAAEELGAGLVKLHVSNRRLNEAADRGDALAAIQEIVISVVGCEEFAIVELDAHGRVAIAASFGLEDAALHTPPLRSAIVREVVDSGRGYYAGDDPRRGGEHAETTACVPLVADGRVVGAIALYALLPHRNAQLDIADRTLLDLISREAGRALAYRTRSVAGAA
ncbi:MAG TPA: GAF domain-containing protein [Gaiellaceae bacterium]|nr:GAF domain-containing protein [Gaiellaceae bacterium]